MIFRKIKKYFLRKWRRDNGDYTLRLDYNLDKDSVVFDVGGYKGEWAEKIVNKYDCYVYIFEPVREYYNIIFEKFKDNNKVLVYNFALSSKSGLEVIYLNNDSTSLYNYSNNSVNVFTKDIVSFIYNDNITKIDLIKIDIEGSEYSLLNRIIDSNNVRLFSNIQVQFHYLSVRSIYERQLIRFKLLKTHFLTYNYFFIWENWRLKN